MLSAIEAIQAVQQVLSLEKALKRIPDHLKQYTFFGDLDQWHYYSIGDDKLCEYCNQHEAVTYSGSEIRGIFPDLEIVDKNMIYPRVHMTLYKQGKFGAWSKDSCRCVLVRQLSEEPLARTLTDKRVR